ncbi:hypothetical protein Q0Z83_021930 [Actinoplanes sichuanensis]|uniref:LacI family DNA-binding transcriptional regulator n=1 Tax=Actinoplanes sichuanensis TaxID=512349 RepID=A0ABW4AJQ3_9ACTN|nr:LacI family DNA-binding transcriptional regulator [Actinoplanes sichuanensis]BEL04002.1 hypothetical protein Q0Z83_021930 [Actinoplanes sichuanensis]
MGKPTIEDVARAAGVSRATVSRVINNAPGASEAFRSRVRTVIAELGYAPDQAARALASRQQPAIDVVATPLVSVGWLGSHPYYSRVLSGVMTVLDGRDVQLRIQLVDPADVAGLDAVADRVSLGAVLADLPADLAVR